MNDLIFFSFSYPYSNDFVWKRNELVELQDHFNVNIIPFTYQKTEALTNVPIKVKVEKPIVNGVIRGTWAGIYKSILTPRVFYYYREFFRKKVYLDKQWILDWIASISSIETLYRDPIMKSILKRKEKNKNTILYFYWGAGSTVIIPFLKTLDYKKIVVRFHGFDLYEDRKIGYIPFRTDLLKTITSAVFISDHGQKYIHENYPKINVNSHVFRLGTKKLGESKPSTDNKLRIVSCSNIIPLKRVSLIANALSMLDFKVEWTHFGDGELFEELKNQVKSLPANIEVRLLGRKTPDEVLHYYSNNFIDLFLNVSTTEGVPVSVMEAFSASIPVYATSVGGTPEIVNSTNGSLLDPEITATELGNSIHQFFHLNNEEKDSLRIGAQKTFEKKCDFSQLNDRFIDFLKS